MRVVALIARDPGDETRIHSDREIIIWRFDALRAAGYPSNVALTLAERVDVDLHLACRILEEGATLDQAIRILT